MSIYVGCLDTFVFYINTQSENINLIDYNNKTTEAN